MIRSHSGLQFRPRLGNQSFAVNLEEFGRLFRAQELLPKLKGDLLCLHFLVTDGAVSLRFRLRHFWLLLPASIDRDSNAKRHRVVGTELRRVRSLPHVLQIEIRVEVLFGGIHLQALLLNHFLRASDFRIARLRCS